MDADRRRPETVSATEIAAWVYCPESWRLTKLGRRSANEPAREAGLAHHGRMARFERRSGCFGALCQLLLGVGLLIITLSWVLS